MQMLPCTLREGRVTEMFKRFQKEWSLPDTSYDWFNETANKRWRDHICKKLKPAFDMAKGNFAQAITNRPTGLINESNWAVLCKHFSEINEPHPVTGKSKSASCSSSRKKVKHNHGFGRTSIAAWSDKYVEKFNKEPTVAHVFDKGYLRIDAIKSDEDPSSSTQNPNGLCASNELREISQKLHIGVEEQIAAGSEESVAGTKTVLEVFGRCKLGVSQSKKAKVQSIKRNKTIQIEQELAESKAYSASLERRIARLEAACMQSGIQMSEESLSSRREEEED